jgi:ABC-2 type transport system ATP-binding protein
MINVSELTKDYGARRAIDNLSFNAQQGEIVGFLGPNGAGKTTTMRILSGYMPPTSGTAEIGGHDVVKESLEVRKLVGYLPETVPLYPDMTVFDYLMYMADLHKVPKADERVDAVLELVHMEDRSKGYIGNLSKGMRQRIGLAQALVHDPQVLILDEPTIGLDPAQIIEVRKLIQDIGKQKTVLLSTHILSEAQQICNRVLIINKGRIVAEDTPERLQTRLAGGRRVMIRVRDHAEDALPIIKNTPGVITVSTKDDDTIIFETAANQDVRPDVARAIIRSGLDLLELHAEGMSLEDIFLELTRDEPSSLTMARPDLEDASDEAELVEEE